jgi:very-short-patch-repair endonuclease
VPTRKLPDYTKTNARTLRRDSTDAEAVIWYNLRRHGVAGYKFRRQHPFGPYILDFYCPSAGLVVELDGSQHLEPHNALRDQAKTEFLHEQGLRVLRFDNIQALKETRAVLEVILAALESPLPSGGEGTDEGEGTPRLTRHETCPT